MSKLGEYIRTAKAIFEFFNGEVIEVDVNLWVREAKEYQKLFRSASLEDLLRHIQEPVPVK